MITAIITNNEKLTNTLPDFYIEYCAILRIEEDKKKTKYTIFVSIMVIYNYSDLIKLLRNELIHILV